MSPKVPLTARLFVTGVTGYVGGDAIVALLQKYPYWESRTSVLVRDTTKSRAVSALFPHIRIVHGSLDDYELLEREAANADIILNFASSDHPLSAAALVRGAQRHDTKSPTFLIHTSGTGILTWETVQKGTYGDLEPKIYNDWDGIDELISLPDFAAHRDVDKIILEAGSGNAESVVKTAIVCPPTIYGVGRGPGNKRSQQLYDLTSMILTAGEGMRVGRGENKQTHVHVRDLSDLYILLIEHAALGGGDATWGKHGYYFSSSGDQAWGDIAKLITTTAYGMGYITSDCVSEFSSEQLAKSAGHSHAALIFGGNAREESIRAKRLLGWNPSRPSLVDEISTAVHSEAVRLGLPVKQLP